MSERSSSIHVRMDTDLKRRATEALSELGLTASDAVRLLFHRIAVDRALPPELKVPNAETRAAMAEAEEILNARRGGPATAGAMIADPERKDR